MLLWRAKPDKPMRWRSPSGISPQPDQCWRPSSAVMQGHKKGAIAGTRNGLASLSPVSFCATRPPLNPAVHLHIVRFATPLVCRGAPVGWGMIHITSIACRGSCPAAAIACAGVVEGPTASLREATRVVRCVINNNLATVDRCRDRTAWAGPFWLSSGLVFDGIAGHRYTSQYAQSSLPRLKGPVHMPDRNHTPCVQHGTLD